jgi:translation initiation factor IF-2
MDEGAALLRAAGRPGRGRPRAHGRPRRPADPGPQLLGLRDRRQDLALRPPQPAPAPGARPRGRRRGGRGGRGRRQLVGGRPGAGRRGHPRRHLRRVPARLDDGLPQPGDDRLPVRRRLRRAHARPGQGPGCRRRQPHPRGAVVRRGVAGRAAELRHQRSGARPGRPGPDRGGGRRRADRLPARPAGPGPRRGQGVPGRAAPAAPGAGRRPGRARRGHRGRRQRHGGGGPRADRRARGRRHRRRRRLRRGPGGRPADGRPPGDGQLLRRPAQGHAHPSPATPTSSTTARWASSAPTAPAPITTGRPWT